MKAIIGTAVGILGLGGLVVAGSNRSAAPATTVAIGERTAIASGQTLVDCGDGHRAFVQPQPNGASHVLCVPVAGVQASADGMPYAQFASQYQAVPAAPVQALPTIVQQERVVYRDRPVARTTTARRASARPAAQTVSAPVYRDEPKEPRSWKKSALIIGGATAGGAGVGAILDGKSGAKKGAVVGLVGGTVYDIATRNK